MKTYITLMAALTLLPATFAHADTMKMQHGEMQTTSAAAEMAEGEVKKIDATAGRITLKHGPLNNLGMPGMTMVFGVKDKAMLKKVKLGDQVNFVAEMVNGLPTVTKIEQAK